MAIFKKILVAYDGSTYSKKALDKAIEFMKEDQSVQTHVVNVINPPHVDLYSLYGLTLSQEVLKEMDEANEKSIEEAKELLKNYTKNCHFERLQGDVSQKIIDYANEHDIELIIVGSRGLGTFKGMVLGSVSSRVVQHADSHVLVIK